MQELKLAEKWARKHQLPFPKIDEGVYEKEGMKECYVFRDEEDMRAPIILHFVLCNVQYKKYSAPGLQEKKYVVLLIAGFILEYITELCSINYNSTDS